MSSSSAGLGFITNSLCLVIIWSLLVYLASGLSSSSAFSFGFCFTIRSLPCHPRVLLYLFVLYRLVSALSYGFCFTILFLLYHLGVPLYYLISAQLLRTAPLFRLRGSRLCVIYTSRTLCYVSHCALYICKLFNSSEYLTFKKLCIHTYKSNI